VGAIITGVGLGLLSLCTVLPDATLTKVIAVSCVVVAAVVTLSCCIAAIFY